MPAVTPGRFLMERPDLPPALPVEIPTFIELWNKEVGEEGEGDGKKVESFNKILDKR